MALVAVVGVLLVAALAFVLSTNDSGDDGAGAEGSPSASTTRVPATSSPAGEGGAVEEWKTYENREHAYAIRYPPDWTLEEAPTRCDGTFCQQHIELKLGDEASVFVAVNLQGGWCEEGVPGPIAYDIVVSGREGKEYYCEGFTIRSFGPGDSVIRFFPGAQGKVNYLVLGQAHDDLTEVRAIVETFRLLD